MDNEQPPIKTGLLDFLRKSVGSQFVIPVYQRNYTWTAKKEVKQYLNDLTNILNGKYNRHFLGIIIYLENPLDAFSREFSVIDGQQRLTTTFLILYAIKYLYIKNGFSQQAILINNRFLVNSDCSNTKLKLKLKPLVSDDLVYKQIVESNLSEITNKASNVYKNFIYISTYLEQISINHTLDEILNAMNNLYIVCIPVAKEDNAQKIFESINSTGAKLSSSDLIRNYVLMEIPSDTQDMYYKKYWKKIEYYLTPNSKKLEDFFRFFLASKNSYLSNKSSIYEDFKIWYSNQLLNSSIEDILQILVDYSKYYYTLYFAPLETLDPVLISSLKEFRKIASFMPSPLLMELYKIHQQKKENGLPKITSFQFSQIIDVLNNYLIRRAICGLDTSDITRLFPIVLKDTLIDCNVDFGNVVEYVKKNLINKNRGKSAYMPTNADLSQILTYSNVYNLRATLRIIFDRIEHENNPAPVDLSGLSIEHLMPQTSTSEWLDALQIDEDTYQKNLNRIGNLTLASKSDNSKMRNFPWKYKQKILKKTAHLKMNQEILKNEKWTISNIDDRTETLIKNINLLYPYSSASNEVIKKHVISIIKDKIIVEAIFYEEDGSVEIQPTSSIASYATPHLLDDIDSLYHELVDEEIIQETDEGPIFIKPYLMSPQTNNGTALSKSAALATHQSVNGWDCWIDETTNKPPQDSIELKELFKRK